MGILHAELGCNMKGLVATIALLCLPTIPITKGVDPISA
jgi:hypothetical protein